MPMLPLVLAALVKPLWEVDAGPLVVGSNGLHAEPQLDFGAHLGNFRLHAGLEDVRDGLSISAGAEVAQMVQPWSVFELSLSHEIRVPGCTSTERGPTLPE